ncbi:hypothetical protein CONPUDRAFT_137053 [Coniophora puteana RWD-64-598 SS2]|uniref:Rhodopsin domain-containing protein n=1 Tax=Coniophora puteana (strain RWD-64-598) TaxID=741705 RepID=A0A5M3MP30_CONPW|nr:uncharacterized protein CONPUDRAFT_137053 [Coniophora puteana RWD-64-598 SS2]EIW80919.1 hypothetical protein CONPUDRAFT_137053 [Coniophora puteana RWD-64-598 SS2]
MMAPTLSFSELKIAGLILSLFSILTALLRLIYRHYLRKLWMDDAAVAIAMGFQLLQTIFTQVRYNPGSYHRETLVAAYYIAAIAFLGVVWLSRISILWTVMRLAARKNTRRFLLVCIVMYAAAMSILIAQEVWVCEQYSSWKSEALPQCDLGKRVGIAQIVTDVIADLTLIVAPIRLVYKVRLSRTEKIRVLAIFCSSAATTIVSTVHAYYLTTVGGADEILAGIVEMSVSLIVANLSVIIAFLCRIGQDSSNEPVDRSETSQIVTFGAVPSRRRIDILPVHVDVHMETFSEVPTKPGYDVRHTGGDDDVESVRNRSQQDSKATCSTTEYPS